MEEFSDVRFKQRAVTEFFTVEKFPPVEIHRRMQAVYGDQCVDVSTVRRWVRRVKDGELGQADLSDKTRSGRAVTASDQLHLYLLIKVDTLLPSLHFPSLVDIS